MYIYVYIYIYIYVRSFRHINPAIPRSQLQVLTDDQKKKKEFEKDCTKSVAKLP